MKKNNLAIQNINGVRLSREDIDQAKEWDDLIGLWHNTTEVDRLAQWYKGDIAVRIGIIFGEDSLGQFAQEVGESRSALDNYRRVARAFPPDKRDYNLPFYTFLAASLADSFDKGKKEFASERRFGWVEKAETNNWSFLRLRQEMEGVQRLNRGDSQYTLCLDYVKKFEGILLHTEVSKLSKEEWEQIIKRINTLAIQLKTKIVG